MNIFGKVFLRKDYINKQNIVIPKNSDGYIVKVYNNGDRDIIFKDNIIGNFTIEEFEDYCYTIFLYPPLDL